MELKSNAERFLDAYAQLETKMASLAKETRYVPFSQLLSRLAPHNRIITYAWCKAGNHCTAL